MNKLNQTSFEDAYVHGFHFYDKWHCQKEFAELQALGKDTYNGHFRLKLKAKLWLYSALFYLDFPLKLIPSFIPFIGGYDDSLLIHFMYKKFQKELKTYKDWKVSKRN